MITKELENYSKNMEDNIHNLLQPRSTFFNLKKRSSRTTAKLHNGCTLITIIDYSIKDYKAQNVYGRTSHLLCN